MKRRSFVNAALLAPVALPALTPRPAPRRPVDGFVVRAGESRTGVHTPYRGVNPNDVKVSGKDTDGALAVFEYTGTQPIGPPLHTHAGQDELFYILEGEYLFQVGDQQFTARPGDTVFGPRGVPHSWLQQSERGKIVYSVQPAGKLEAFFLRMSQQQGPLSEADAQWIHREHDMTIVGPPITAR
ncbi:cupin domain-containing protein [Spirosoma luteolum]